MLIKPLIKGRVNSLPSNGRNPQSIKSSVAHFGTLEERIEFLEVEGRLLMLPIMYSEWNLKSNKSIHDNNGRCINRWPICTCHFARRIRAKDLGLTNLEEI